MKLRKMKLEKRAGPNSYKGFDFYAEVPKDPWKGFQHNKIEWLYILETLFWLQ